AERSNRSRRLAAAGDARRARSVQPLSRAVAWDGRLRVLERSLRTGPLAARAATRRVVLRGRTAPQRTSRARRARTGLQGGNGGRTGGSVGGRDRATVRLTRPHPPTRTADSVSTA